MDDIASLPSLPSLDRLVRSVEDAAADDLDRVRTAVTVADELGSQGDALVTHFVGAARAAGCSWSQIGAQLGVSKQAAQQAFVVAPGEGRRRGRFGRRGGMGGGPGGAGRPGGGGLGLGRGALRAVVLLARQEAVALGHGHVGTEHLLLGILSEGDGGGARALAELGVRADDVRAQVEALVATGPDTPRGLRTPMTPRSKKVLELSVREALRLHADHVDSGHLLLGLVREGEGLAARILVDLGAELATVKATTEELLRAAKDAAAPDGPPSPAG